MGVYVQTELDQVPEVALNLSRGCGNPTGFANLQSGEVVVDFGCGGVNTPSMPIAAWWIGVTSRTQNEAILVV